MRVQIYTMQSVAEARAVAALGVEHVGITPADHGLPGEVDEVLAADICRELEGAATTVALSVDTDLDVITGMAGAVGPDIVHLCGPPGVVGPGAVVELRRRLHGLEVMQAVAITGSDAVNVARAYAPVVDYLILDSVTPDVMGIGAAGTTHDWRVSAAIVAAVEVPVILAGGLSADNVGEAIAAVDPWGVDSLTHTNSFEPTGGFRKDLEAVRGFASAARGEVMQ